MRFKLSFGFTKFAAVAVVGMLALGAFGLAQTGLVSPGSSSLQNINLTDEEMEGAAAERYPVAEGFSAEAEAAFASVMHISNGTDQELSLKDLPAGSYSGFMFALSDAATGAGDRVACAQEAVSQGLVKQVHGSIYQVDSLDTLAGLFAADQLAYVEPDYRMQVVGEADQNAQVTGEADQDAQMQPGIATLLSVQGGTAANPAPAYPPSDPHYLAGDLWNLDMLKVQGAWDLGLDGDIYVHNNTPVRDGAVRVAVIDTGFYGTGEGEEPHEDFDYSHVVDGDNFVTSQDGTPDAQGHGTFVSGLIAAQVNNGVGVAGLTPGAYIVPCKVFDTGSASTSDIVKAIYYATDDAKVDVINMSLGGEYNDASLQAACDYAVAQGVIVVASAGNDGVSTPNYPAAYDSVVGVASVDFSQTRSSWSQYGKSVFVTAPGESVTSTFKGASNAYKTASGTSFSGPEVAALAAMCKAVYPDMNQDAFKDFLIETSTDLGSRGFDDYYGYGLVNFEAMAKTVLASQTLPWYHLSFDVTTMEGTPIQDATVVLTAAEDITWADDPQEGIEAGSLAAGAVIAPGADGTYRVHRGLYSYAVSAPGYYLSTGTVKTYGENQRVEVSLEESFEVAIRIQDGKGRLLPEAELKVMSPAGRVELPQSQKEGAACYNLMSGVYSFSVMAAGYEKMGGSFEVQRSNQDLTLTLRQEAELSWVRFQVRDGESDQQLTKVGTAVYDSQGVLLAPDEEGAYRLARGEAYRAIVTRLGYEDAVCAFTVEDAAQMDVAVPLNPAASMVTFRPVTEEGKDLSYATVVVWDADGAEKPSSATNALRYNLKAGSYSYTLSAPGYESVNGSFSVSVESRTLTVVMSGIPQRVVFDLTDQRTGNTLADASVKVSTATSAAAIKANADGSYSLSPGDYRFSVCCPGYQSQRGSFTVGGEALLLPVSLEPYAAASEGYAGGAGTVDDPYLIATEDQLRHLAQQTEIFRAKNTSAQTNQSRTVGGYYQLVADINLTDAWLPIGNYENGNNYVAFAGNFDGAGHTISNLSTVEADCSAQGLFGCVQNAHISNLTVEGSVVGDSYVGGLVGVVRFIYDASYPGWNTGTSRLENCVSKVEVTGRYAVGGLVGSTQGSSASSSDYGTVVSQCANYGVVQAICQGEFSRRASCAGGVVGSAGNCKVEYCYNRGRVEAGYNAGGLVGQSLGLLGMYNSYNVGMVYEHVTGTGYANTSGSLAGRLTRSDISACYGLVPADEDAVTVTIGQIDSYTTVSRYGMRERSELWRNVDFVASLNTDAHTDVVSSTFVVGAGYPLLKHEVSADQVLAEEPFVVAQPLTPATSYKVGQIADPLTASVEAVSDGGVVTWQWYEVSFEGRSARVALEGASGQGLTATYAPSTDSVGSRTYQVVFTNTLSAGDCQGQTSTESGFATIIVRSDVDAQVPEITAFNPTSAQAVNTSVSAKVTSDILLSVEAMVEDGGTLSYQWYKGSTMAGKGTAVADAIQASYQPPTSSLGTTYYYVEITNTYEPGNAVSVKSPWVAVEVTEYTISSPEELLSFCTAVNSGQDFAGLVVLITDDISLEGQVWEPIGTLEHPFRGTFKGGMTDGSGQVQTHTISGIRVVGEDLADEGIAGRESSGANATSDNLGLFGVVEGATLSNLVLQGTVTGAHNRYAGLLVGRALSTSTASTLIENCGTTADSSVEGKYAIGGLVGSGAIQMKSCVNHGTVLGRAFVPTADDKTLDTYSAATKAVGGLVGYASTDYVQGCYNTGSVSVQALAGGAGQKCAYYVGGVVGSGANTSAVVSCFGTGAVSAGTLADRSISYKPAGVCYIGAVVGYQVYDQLYNVHYLDGVCGVGTNSTCGYDYAENHSLAYMKTAYFLDQLHDGYGFGSGFALSQNGVPHLVWEQDDTSGNPLTDAAEPYLFDVTIEGIDDLTSTWNTYFYQGEVIPDMVVWADQVQPQGGALTYQWEQRPEGGGEDSWQPVEGASGMCASLGDSFAAPLRLSSEAVGTTEYRCIVTNTLAEAEGIPCASNETPVITIAIRENIGTFALRDQTQPNSADNPWVITRADQLHFLALLTRGETKMVGLTDTSFLGQYVCLEGDVDLSGFSPWTPIGRGDGYAGQPFRGYFDGLGHHVTGLQIGAVGAPAEASDYQGLFGSVCGGALRNLCVSGVVNVAAGGWTTGGVVGYAYGSALENLANHADVTGSVRVGGVVGAMGTCQVKDCVNTGTVTVADATSTSNYGVGGIAGYGFDSVNPEGAGLFNCVNTGRVSCTLAYGTDPRFGAILGEVGSGNVPLTGCSYLAGSAMCINDGSCATGCGSRQGSVDDGEGTVFSFDAGDAAKVSWLMNTRQGSAANVGRWGLVCADGHGAPSTPGLVMCGTLPLYRVVTDVQAAQIVASPEYATPGQTVTVSWRNKPGYQVTSLRFGLTLEDVSTYETLAQGQSFSMPAGDVSFDLTYEQDTRYRYNLYSSVVDDLGAASDKASLAFDPLLGDEPTACEGDQVGFSLSVAEGYQVRSVTAAGLFGTKVTVSRIEDGAYAFTMPGDLVTVTVTVEPEGTPADKQAASLGITATNVHIYNADGAYQTGNLLYDTLALSGSLVGRNRYVTTYQLEVASGTPALYEQTYTVAGQSHRVTGVSLAELIRQFVDDRTQLVADTPVTLETAAGTSVTYTWDQIASLGYNAYEYGQGQPTVRGLPVLLAFGQDGQPFVDRAIHLVFGQTSFGDDNGARNLTDVVRIVVGTDINYAQHCYAPYDNLASVGGSDVSVNIYQGEDLVATKTYSVKDIEALASGDRSGIYRGLYSALVYDNDETSFGGPYSDYYEGYDLYDVLLAAGLSPDAALANPDAKVQFYQKGGWTQAWKTVSVSLGYLAGNGAAGLRDYSQNFTMYGREEGTDSQGIKISGMAPLLAYGKNNLPLVYTNGSTGSSGTAYNYRGPLIALLPQNILEGGYVSDQSVAACYLGQIDVYLPAEQDQLFVVSAADYTSLLEMRKVTYRATVPDGMMVTVAGKAMAAPEGGYPQCLVEPDVAATLTEDSFKLVPGTMPVFVLGDANGNGVFNVVDAQIAYDMVKGRYADFSQLPERMWLPCDVNDDGVVDIADIRVFRHAFNTGGVLGAHSLG